MVTSMQNSNTEQRNPYKINTKKTVTRTPCYCPKPAGVLSQPMENVGISA